MRSFCGNCGHLNPTERNQTNKKEKHICVKYNQQVYHDMAHPHIIRLFDCIKDMLDKK